MAGAGLILNEECCFSCSNPFDATRAEIKISENYDAIRKILDIDFGADAANGTMNLCLACNFKFQDAKEDYLQLVELEKQFHSKRTKFAFTVVKSVEEDDYLGVSLKDPMLNARVHIYNKWHKLYKKDAAAKVVTNKDCSTVALNASSASVLPALPQLIIPVGQDGQTTGKDLRIQKDGSAVLHPSPVMQQPQASLALRIQKDESALLQSSPVVQQSQAIVPMLNKCTNNPKAQAPKPVNLAKETLPFVTSATNPSSSEGAQKNDSPELPKRLDKKKRRVHFQDEASPTSSTLISRRSRRVIRKPFNDCWVYGKEYVRAVKNSSKKPQRKVKKPTSDSTSNVDEESSSYVGTMQDEGERTPDHFEEEHDRSAEGAQEECGGTYRLPPRILPPTASKPELTAYRLETRPYRQPPRILPPPSAPPPSQNLPPTASDPTASTPEPTASVRAWSIY